MRFAIVACLVLAGLAAANEPAIEKGKVNFVPLGNQENIPKRYRLDQHRFEYRLKKIKDLPVNGVEIYELQFPSPAPSPCPENNPVHPAYYPPNRKGPFPCPIPSPL